MIKIFEEIRLLRKELDDLKSNLSRQHNEILELCKRVDSNAYNDMIGKYNAKEKRLYKKAVEIITSGEKPNLDFFAGEDVFVSENGVLGKIWNTKIDYKDLHFLKNRRGLTVIYKDFTFNDENSKLLWDLHHSLHNVFR